MGAVIGEHVETIKALLSSGANVNFRSMHDYTALKYAERGRNEEIIRILKEAGATN